MKYGVYGILGVLLSLYACGGENTTESATDGKTVEQAAVAYCNCKRLEAKMEQDSEKGASEEFLKCNEAYMKEFEALNANVDSSTAIMNLVSINCK